LSSEFQYSPIEDPHITPHPPTNNPFFSADYHSAITEYSIHFLPIVGIKIQKWGSSKQFRMSGDEYMLSPLFFELFLTFIMAWILD
jgi:hypothetical protein